MKTDFKNRFGTTSRRWTPEHEAFVRSNIGSMPYAQIAQHLQRTEVSIRSFVKSRKLVQKRFWTPAEIEFLKANKDMPAPYIAKALNRSLKSVWAARKVHGLSKKLPSFKDDFTVFVQAKHSLGWTDAEISQAWGCERHTVGERRKKLGLPDNALSEHRRRTVAEKTRQQCAAAGVKSLAEIRVQAFRKYARDNGLPEDLRPRAVHILNALATHGPMTRRQIADAVGMPWKGSRKSLHSNDPEGSHLAHLMKRGLVVCLGRIAKGKGRGHSTNIYSIPLWTERTTHEETKQSTDAGPGQPADTSMDRENAFCS